MRSFVITGAGISAESGIPTFRGKGGYWRNLDPTKLATPEAFARDPELVWEWYRERREKIRAARPNAAHESLVRLATLSDEFLLLTQNVDDLHARAQFEGHRIPKEQIVQIHGDIFLTRCSQCGFGVREHVRAFKAATSRRTPKCPECGGLMRPGVVWFGEQLDLGKIEAVESYLGSGPCDLVMVIGTTALFGYVVDWAVRARGKQGQLIEVNPAETSLSSFATRVVREPAAVALPRLVDRIANA
jgi:NAD-dependent deacetylase